MLDLISIGDATLDTFVKINDASVMCTLEKEVCMLCLNYADKIPIARLDQKVAGNACNVATGGARLGLKTAFYSIVGNDDIGKRVTRAMKSEGVSLKYVEVDKGRPSNYSVVLNYKSERTILVYHHPRHYKMPKLEPANWIYYTSIGANHESLERSILKYLRTTHPRPHLAFNPGTHQLRKGLSRLRDVLRMTTVLFVNKEEAEGLVGRAGDMKGLLDRLKETGPEISVITDGAKGSFVHNGGEYWYMPVYPVKVVEKTGAGDSFAIGFVGALAHGKKLHEALQWGTANSASVVTKIGPQPGLLTVAGIQQMTRKYKKIKPKKI